MLLDCRGQIGHPLLLLARLDHILLLLLLVATVVVSAHLDNLLGRELVQSARMDCDNGRVRLLLLLLLLVDGPSRGVDLSHRLLAQQVIDQLWARLRWLEAELLSGRRLVAAAAARQRT